jgi:hypothetical protein
MPHPRSPRAWDQACISYVCVCGLYFQNFHALSQSLDQHFCAASQFCSVSGGNLIKHIFKSRSREGILFSPSFLHHCSKRPITFTKCFSVLLRVHGAYMSARVNYHLLGNFFFFFFSQASQWLYPMWQMLNLNSQGH